MEAWMSCLISESLGYFREWKCLAVRRMRFRLGCDKPLHHMISGLDSSSCKIEAFRFIPAFRTPSGLGIRHISPFQLHSLAFFIMSTESFDVVVVGGGPIGLSSAYEVAKKGKKVLVLEQSSFFNQEGSSGDLVRMFRTMYVNFLLSSQMIEVHILQKIWRV